MKNRARKKAQAFGLLFDAAEISRLSDGYEYEDDSLVLDAGQKIARGENGLSHSNHLPLEDRRARYLKTTEKHVARGNGCSDFRPARRLNGPPGNLSSGRYEQSARVLILVEGSSPSLLSCFEIRSNAGRIALVTATRARSALDATFRSRPASNCARIADC